MIVTKRESMASLIHDTSPTLRHSLQVLDDSDQRKKYDISESIIQALIMTLLQTMS